VKQGPDAPESKWKVRSSVAWTLGGHCAREDTRIEMEGMEQPLVFVVLYGWDVENQRHVLTEAGNLGQLMMTEVRFSDDGAMLTARTHVTGGQLVAERWVHRIDGDTWRFHGDEAIQDGPFFRHVAGEMKRIDAEPSDIEIVDAAFMPEIAASTKPHLDRLGSLAGTYRIDGWFKMTTEMPKTAFTGTEAVRAVFGGTLRECRTKGDSMPGLGEYAALGWLAWDDHDRAFTMVIANNFGEIGEQPLHLMDDRTLVATNAARYMGQPCVMRGVFQLDENGAYNRATSHMMIGDEPAALVFEATYERQ
jgi:hypothetical protein